MITYFTEFARWVGSTTGLVVSYVRGLLFNNDDDPTDASITETTVHKQDFDTIVTVTETSYTKPPHISLPQKLKNKRAIINILNKDDECFKWAVTRALDPVERNPERITKTLRKQSIQYNWQDISFPTTLDNIETFEANNSLLINVFGFDEEKSCVYPLRVPKGRHADRVLLMLIGDDGDKSHYTIVKCMSRLPQGQAIKKKCRRFYCNNCLNGFTSEKTLQNHVIHCDDCVIDECKLKPRAWIRKKKD